MHRGGWQICVESGEGEGEGERPSTFLPAVSSAGAPVLNRNPSGSPLTFRSALSGPYRAQWLLASDTELVKLVETTRTLCPVHFASSPPTYFNPIPKEK